ncbi:helix-turn-helix transcriptional regulator [Avibacterium paragallinarum]|uniref:helix-turn-helix transcriptional regulator n=1 Tax=Avibacterium paragallinarum TaxID=728 RepID=UPI0021F7D3AE|nr:AlpA family phage regulatory protein [Avibacterium paragallinarum]UXN34892.1 AlpA family phage regulatory protein [Avibacterium paragallinarum]
MALLTLKELQEMKIGGRTKIYHLVKSGDFPKPIKIGKRSLWQLEDVQAWLTKHNPNKGLTQ